MKLKPLLIIFIAFHLLSACNGNNHRFTVIGAIDGMPVQTVILEQLTANDFITIVDSQRSKPDGHFELSALSPEPGLYRLHFQPNKFILLSIDKGNLKVAADWKNLENYTVSGSPQSQHLEKFIAALRNNICDFNTLNVVLDTLRNRGNDSVSAEASKDLQNMKTQFTQMVEHYADTTPYEPNAVFAARILNPATEGDFLNAFGQSLMLRWPATRMTRDFAEYFAKASKPVKPAQQAGGAFVGGAAPEIQLPDVDGRKISLSSFRGKYVLVDFWASWCNPCRGENPNVVAAYQRFKDKNFTIYSVSLDNNRAAWQKAIQDDKLTWTQVSDLRGWSSAAATAYVVESIPSNYLVDPQGTIVAANLRGAALEEQLQHFLTQGGK